MIPWEGLLPYAVIGTFFTVLGGSVSGLNYYRNGYKRDRFNLDQWDRQQFERDFRITGKYRGQSDNLKAPEAFATNGFRKLQKEPKWW